MANENAGGMCQALKLRGSSTRVPSMLALLYRFQGFRRNHGWIPMFQKICGLFMPKPFARCHAPVQRSVSLCEPALQLESGDWVEVKSYEEIRQTLDENQRHRGLLFMSEMATYCGKRLQVHKVVKRILLEDTREVRRLRNTVLLAGSTCSGLSVGCDRCCFHFWREAWLRRVDDASHDV